MLQARPNLASKWRFDASFNQVASPLPIKHGNFPIKQGHPPIKHGHSPPPSTRRCSTLRPTTSPINHGRVLIKHGRSPLTRGHFPIKHGRFHPGAGFASHRGGAVVYSAKAPAAFLWRVKGGADAPPAAGPLDDAPAGGEKKKKPRVKKDHTRKSRPQ